jgi:hypothetical protein
MASKEHRRLNNGVDDLDISHYDLGPVGPWLKVPSIRKSQFFAELLTRLVCGRDMNIIVTAASETGVGKTTLAVAIAMLMDQQGWDAEKASVANAQKYDWLYDQCLPGSCLILDEAEEAADGRRAMASESVSLTQSFATKRYRQVFSILTAPSKSWVDKRLGGDAADYWIQAQEGDFGRITGQAIVYRLRTNEHYETDYADREEWITWPNLDAHEEFQKLDQRKETILESDGEKTYYRKEEVEEMREQTEKKVREKQRKAVIKSLNKLDKVTQNDIAEVFDISQGRVSQLINKE